MVDSEGAATLDYTSLHEERNKACFFCASDTAATSQKKEELMEVFIVMATHNSFDDAPFTVNEVETYRNGSEAFC